MNKNIGVIIPDLEMSQRNFEFIHCINQEIMNNSEYDYRIFFENISGICIEPQCGLMNISEIYSYNGLLISTTLDNTKMALKTVGDIQRVFYIWDLEFIRNEKNFIENLKVYRNPNLFLISRSQEYDDALANYANRRANLIMSKLSLTEIKEKVNNVKSS